MPSHHHCQRRPPLLPCCLSSLILMQLLLVQQALGSFLPSVSSSNIPNILKDKGTDNGETTTTLRSSSSRFLRHRATTDFLQDMDTNTKINTRQLPFLPRSQRNLQKGNANNNNVQNMTKVNNDQNNTTNNNNPKGQKLKAAKGVWMEGEKTHKKENNRPTSTAPSPAPNAFSEEISDEDENAVSQEVETTEPTGGAVDESFAGDNDDDDESISSPEEVERRPEPTNLEPEYLPEEPKLTSSKANTDDFEDEEASAEEAAKVEEYEKEEEKLEKELSMEKREVRRIGGFSFLLAVIAMVFTAQQMSENPDGIYASFCRLIITLFGCAFKMALVPVRSFVGGSRPYGHMPVSTMDYNYRDPYRPGADSMELS